VMLNFRKLRRNWGVSRWRVLRTSDRADLTLDRLAATWATICLLWKLNVPCLAS
jgi:hypothetical protein